MKAFAQHLSGLLRIGPDTDKWPKPWEFMLGYGSVDPDTVVLFGLKSGGGFGFAHVAALRPVLRDMGFKWAVWDRYDDEGRHRPVRVRV